MCQMLKISHKILLKKNFSHQMAFLAYLSCVNCESQFIYLSRMNIEQLIVCTNLKKIIFDFRIKKTPKPKLLKFGLNVKHTN